MVEGREGKKGGRRGSEREGGERREPRERKEREREVERKRWLERQSGEDEGWGMVW